MVKVAPSILSADFVNLERDIRALAPAGASARTSRSRLTKSAERMEGASLVIEKTAGFFIQPIISNFSHEVNAAILDL